LSAVDQFNKNYSDGSYVFGDCKNFEWVSKHLKLKTFFHILIKPLLKTHYSAHKVFPAE
jgi:hypothetical protein